MMLVPRLRGLCTHCRSVRLPAPNVPSVSSRHRSAHTNVSLIRDSPQSNSTSTAVASAAAPVHNEASPSLSSYLCDGCGETVRWKGRHTHLCYRRAKGKPTVYDCPECDQQVPWTVRHSHPCYRRANGLQMHECEHCQKAFVSKSALDAHIKFFPGEHSAFERSVVITPDEFSSSERLLRPMKVLDNCVTHSTTSEGMAQIKGDGYFRGGSKDLTSGYDGAMSLPDAPTSVYFQCHPETDLMFFPFSRFPKSGERGDACRIAVVGLDFLGSDDYQLYHVKTTPTLFGPANRAHVHTHLVAAAEDEQEFCDAHLTRLPKQDNRFLWRDSAGWHFSSQISYSRDSRYRRPHNHKIVLAVVGSLALPSDTKWINGTTLQWKQGQFECPEPKCSTRCETASDLKYHYRTSHVEGEDVRHRCKEPDCSATQQTLSGLNDHVRRKHRGKRLECPYEKCEKTYASTRGLNAHILSAHHRIRLDCPYFNERCYKTFSSQSSLVTHIRTIHGKARVACTVRRCGKTFPGEPSLRLHLRRAHGVEATRGLQKSVL